MNDNQKNFSFLGLVLILVIATGALAGVIASVYTNQSLERYVASLAESDNLLSISQVKPQPLPGTYEEALERVRENSWPAFASILPASSDSLDLTDWIGQEDAIGSGIVVTNDGWILSHQSSLPNNPAAQEVWIAGKRYSIDRVVEDDLTDYVLLKVEADGLTSIAFGGSQEMKGGEIIFNLPANGQLISANLESARYHDSSFVLPAEEFAYHWQTSSGLREGQLLNSNGELIGFMTGEEEASPIHYAVSFIQSVLRSGETEHAALGVYTVDLSSVLNFDQQAVGNLKVGAMVQRNVRGVSVLRNSPAAAAGLKEGDVILSIDGAQISSSQTLAEILAGYTVGDSVMIKFWQDGEEKSQEVELVNFDDLAY